MLPASIVPKSGQVLRSHHCRVSSMTYLLHLHMMIRQMVSRGLVYPQRVSRLTYTAPNFRLHFSAAMINLKNWMSLAQFLLHLKNCDKGAIMKNIFFASLIVLSR